MNDPIFTPCSAWAKKLAVFQSNELSSNDRKALDAHLASCMDCKAVLDKYLELDERLHEALSVQRPLQVTTEMLELENTYIFEEESVVSQGSKGDFISRHQQVYRSGPKKLSISFRISFARKIFDTVAPLLVIGILILCFCSIYYIKHPIQQATTAGGHSTGTSQALDPTPIAHPNVTATGPSTPKSYPQLAASYQGNIDDLQANVPSAMTLTGIVQNNGQISGTFVALHMREPFQGFLDTAKHISFYVASSAGQGQLSFTGAVQKDGSLQGQYCAVDQNSQCIPSGVFGLWSVAATT